MAAEPLDPNRPYTSVYWSALNEKVLLLYGRRKTVIALTRREQAALLAILSQQHLEAYRVHALQPEEGVTWTPTKH
jgi:hypothetical protein